LIVVDCGRGPENAGSRPQAQGGASMMSLVKVNKGTLKLPGQDVFVHQGQPVPDGILSAEEVEVLLAQGILAPLNPSGADVLGERLQAAGRWNHDPAALAGKSADQLRAMILDEDASVDVDD